MLTIDRTSTTTTTAPAADAQAAVDDGIAIVATPPPTRTARQLAAVAGVGIVLAVGLLVGRATAPGAAAVPAACTAGIEAAQARAGVSTAMISSAQVARDALAAGDVEQAAMELDRMDASVPRAIAAGQEFHSAARSCR